MRFCSDGPLVMIPVFLAIAATILSMVAAFDCNFFLVSNLSLQEVEVSYGLWTVEEYDAAQTTLFSNRTVTSYIMGDQCMLWGQHDELSRGTFDAPMRVARWISLAGVFVSLVLLLGILYPIFVHVSDRMLRHLASGMVFTGCLMLSSFIAFKSDLCEVNCEMGFSGQACILGSICWFACGCTTGFLRSAYVIKGT